MDSQDGQVMVGTQQEMGEGHGEATIAHNMASVLGVTRNEVNSHTVLEPFGNSMVELFLEQCVIRFPRIGFSPEVTLCIRSGIMLL